MRRFSLWRTGMGDISNSGKNFWEGHLFGAINGLFWAIYFKKEGPKEEKYSWEIEEELLQSLEGIEVIYEEVKANEPEENQFTVHYEYKKKSSVISRIL